MASASRTDIKRAKFVDLAERRVTRAIKDIRLIGNLSNRNNYRYTEEDVAKIVRALKAELDELRLRFEARSGGTNTFKL